MLALIVVSGEVVVSVIARAARAGGCAASGPGGRGRPSGGYLAGRTFLIDRVHLIAQLEKWVSTDDYGRERRRWVKLSEALARSRQELQARAVVIPAPEEIWRRPADTFVARSLGQPEINILDGVVDDGRIRLGDGSLDVSIPAGAPCDRGDRVRVGLRPCDIHVGSGAGSAHMAGTVMLAEQGLLTGEAAHISREELLDEIVEQTKHALTVALNAAEEKA